MIEYKVGTNFDFDLLDIITRLNSANTRCKVTELYGSVSDDSNYAARPKFRLSNIDDGYLKDYIKCASQNGIKFN